MRTICGQNWDKSLLFNSLTGSTKILVFLPPSMCNPVYPLLRPYIQLMTFHSTTESTKDVSKPATGKLFVFRAFYYKKTSYALNSHLNYADSKKILKQWTHFSFKINRPDSTSCWTSSLSLNMSLSDKCLLNGDNECHFCRKRKSNRRLRRVMYFIFEW